MRSRVHLPASPRDTEGLPACCLGRGPPVPPQAVANAPVISVGAACPRATVTKKQGRAESSVSFPVALATGRAGSGAGEALAVRATEMSLLGPAGATCSPSGPRWSVGSRGNEAWRQGV